jgi:hypothetical protein
MNTTTFLGDKPINRVGTRKLHGAITVNELIWRALHPYPDDLKLVT